MVQRALVAICLGLFIQRVIFYYGGYMAYSSDMGSYLMTRNWVLGIDMVGQLPAHFRPPLVGVLLVPLTWLFGDLNGSKLLALIASVVVIIPAYHLARRFMEKWVALAAALAVGIVPSWGHLVAGGYLSLLAYSCWMWSWWALFGILQGKRVSLWHIVAATVLLVGLNQTITALYAVLTPLVVISFSQSRKAALLAFGVGFLASLPWLYFYLPNTVLRYDQLPLVLLTLRKEALGAFLLLLVFYALNRPANRHWLLPGILLLLIGNMSSGDIAAHNVMGRSVSAWPILLVLSGGSVVQKWVENPAWVREGYAVFAFSLTAFIMGALMVWWQATFIYTAKNLDMVTEDNWAAVRWIKENVAEDEKFYVHANGLGWYVGGHANRQWAGSWTQKAPPFYAGEQEAFNCLMGWREGPCVPGTLHTDYQFGYLLLDTWTWQGLYGKPEGWNEPLMGDKVFERNGVVIYYLGGCS